MSDNDVPVYCGPNNELVVAFTESLREAGIPARVVSRTEVDPLVRSLSPDELPAIESAPEGDVYVLVTKERQAAAYELLRSMPRVCPNCAVILLAKARSCQKCGTPHEKEPGPVW
jgi:hypothetical protein